MVPRWKGGNGWMMRRNRRQAPTLMHVVPTAWMCWDAEASGDGVSMANGSGTEDGDVDDTSPMGRTWL